MGPFFDALDRYLVKAENLLIAVPSLVGLGIGTMQVVLRYVFNTGVEWSEAVFVLSTVSAMRMVGVRVVREDKHVRVAAVAKRRKRSFVMSEPNSGLPEHLT